MKKTMGGRFRPALLMAMAVSVLAFATAAKADDRDRDNDNEKTKSPVIAVVGDVSCQPGTEAPGEAAAEVCADAPKPYTATSLWQSQEATAKQIEAMKPNAVALLGDLQYQVGRYSDFKASFDWTYGAFKFLHKPAPGNHEFYDEHGENGVGGYGYFAYYNGFQLNPDGSIPMFAITDPCPTPNASCKAGKTPTNSLAPQPIPLTDGQAGHFEPSGGVETLMSCSNGTCTPADGTPGIGDGWYSYNLGKWHLISLNIECYTQPDVRGADGCLENNKWLARETEWLKKDLAENHAACTLAYWHQPTFSAADSLSEEGIAAGAWWQLLYDAGADLVLNGHDHLYARYAPVKPYFAAGDTSVAGVTGTWLGTADPKRGIREFIVGTGGETLDAVVSTPSSATDFDGAFNQQFLEKATGNYWGVMALTLEPKGYKWDFETALELPGANAAPFSDVGEGSCHNAPRDDDDR